MFAAQIHLVAKAEDGHWTPLYHHALYSATDLAIQGLSVTLQCAETGPRSYQDAAPIRAQAGRAGGATAPGPVPRTPTPRRADCAPHTRWLVVTNGDNAYDPAFWREVAAAPDHVHVLSFDFYSRYQRFTGEQQREAAAATPPLPLRSRAGRLQPRRAACATINAGEGALAVPEACGSQRRPRQCTRKPQPAGRSKRA